ncbi:phospholipase D-like domain-containing protein [Aquicella lusitana]|uniref:Cardiolipin synthase n=1 Tax=Aquicella lusitana TaxID=254246 RepID=A0A370GB05_9COXI|nr:phosphatidylserine/phosphatidylglycerophosphate/cardiolipin synthase family protein [Aquicella lusitana]RDI40975.1 cardiolipin synthase [Aquicella lusitana]VVC73620.1 putative cardiolipin synthase YwiE [Aquicella lusitana]
MDDKATVSQKETIFNADVYFERLLADIRQAKTSIDLETYIYDPDLLGAEVASALADAAARGVQVRLLVDGIGTSNLGMLLGQMEAAGVTIRVFHPSPWSFWQWSRSNYQSFFVVKAVYFLSKINKRNHRKTCRIDENIAYVGSANISQKHLSKARGGEGWHDTIDRLAGFDTSDLKTAFDLAWKGFPIRERIQKSFQKVDLNPVFRLNYSRHLRRVLYKSLLRRLSMATRRIWVTIAYFNPDFFLLKQLIKAAKRGVDVKIILPYQSDVFIMPIIATTFYTRLLKARVEVYEYLPNILHSKVLIIDDWYSIGSSNLNQRSLRHDLEVDVTIQTTEAEEMLESQFKESLTQCRKIEFEDLHKQSFYKKYLGYLLLYGKYFL